MVTAVHPGAWHMQLWDWGGSAPAPPAQGLEVSVSQAGVEVLLLCSGPVCWPCGLHRLECPAASGSDWSWGWLDLCWRKNLRFSSFGLNIEIPF